MGLSRTCGWAMSARFSRVVCAGIALIAVSALSLRLTLACLLAGSDTGVCDPDGADPELARELMPYCANYVDYSVCLPNAGLQLQQSREYPLGRWTNYSAQAKDDWVFRKSREVIQERTGFEKNRTLRRQGVNEFGMNGRIAVRMARNKDCQNAFRALMCYVNFPRCDEHERTLPTCISACENYFVSCGIEKELWRCGPSEFFNAYKAEEPTMSDEDGNPIYTRDYYPGQPFVKNRFGPRGRQEPVCTPAIDGRAAARFSHVRTIIASCIVLVCWAVWKWR